MVVQNATIVDGWSLQLLRLTPHAVEDERVYGFFHCRRCDREWQSPNSWANTWQRCIRCRAEVYSFQQQFLLREAGAKRGDKTHPAEHWGKCRKLGYSCVAGRQRDNNDSSDDNE